MPATAAGPTVDDLKRVIVRHWGYRAFRPLQEAAMKAVLDGRDSLVVLPTGGGKSLCYQAPAVARGDTTVVVSPLIALMKDQVDGLHECGVAARQLNSSLSSEERNTIERELLRGEVKLLFVSPERLVMSGFLNLLRRVNVRTIAIDEAHCISHWGHDFRPEYRQLSQLKTLFPDASFHAYTATATEQVRRDIITQIGLADPLVLVGNFDRPNLTYRILPLRDQTAQVTEVLERHKGEAGIIYCLSRKNVDELTGLLNRKGYKALAYHAGMEPDQRKATQEAFAKEECDLIVATIAFGMGIDRSNIRFVLHTSMPKSIEHYQQETGRAGRDGLPAECVLLHSGGDAMTWRKILEKSAQEPGVDPGFLPNAKKHLEDMDRFARGAICRHRALVEYFGQKFEAENCQACDLCLGDIEPVPDATVMAQKILSCVARVREGFGIKHVISVLRGQAAEGVLKHGHDKLTTFGLLKEHSDKQIRDWVYQLLGQGVLVQTTGEYPLLRLNAGSWAVMKGEREVKLMRRSDKETRAARGEAISWEGVNRELYDQLRDLRKRYATERAVPPYTIFNDATLRDLARVRPSSVEKMKRISGIGETRLREYGQAFWEVIRDHCQRWNVAMDQPLQPAARSLFAPRPTEQRPNASRDLALDLFKKGTSLDEVARQTAKTRGTVIEYLIEYLRRARPARLEPWVHRTIYEQVAAAARKVGKSPLKPIFLELGEQVSYDEIKLVLAHLEATGAE